MIAPTWTLVVFSLVTCASSSDCVGASAADSCFKGGVPPSTPLDDEVSLLQMNVALSREEEQDASAAGWDYCYCYLEPKEGVTREDQSLLKVARAPVYNQKYTTPRMNLQKVLLKAWAQETKDEYNGTSPLLFQQNLYQGTSTLLFQEAFAYEKFWSGVDTRCPAKCLARAQSLQLDLERLDVLVCVDDCEKSCHKVGLEGAASSCVSWHQPKQNSITCFEETPIKHISKETFRLFTEADGLTEVDAMRQCNKYIAKAAFLKILADTGRDRSAGEMTVRSLELVKQLVVLGKPTGRTTSGCNALYLSTTAPGKALLARLQQNNAVLDDDDTRNFSLLISSAMNSCIPQKMRNLPAHFGVRKEGGY